MSPQDDHDVMVSNPFVPRMLPKWAISTPAQGVLTGSLLLGFSSATAHQPGESPGCLIAADKFTLVRRRSERSPIFGEDDLCPILQLYG